MVALLDHFQRQLRMSQTFWRVNNLISLMGVRGLYALISVRIWQKASLNKRNRILGGFDRNDLRLLVGLRNWGVIGTEYLLEQFFPALCIRWTGLIICYNQFVSLVLPVMRNVHRMAYESFLACNKLHYFFLCHNVYSKKVATRLRSLSKFPPHSSPLLRILILKGMSFYFQICFLSYTIAFGFISANLHKKTEILYQKDKKSIVFIRGKSGSYTLLTRDVQFVVPILAHFSGLCHT